LGTSDVWALGIVPLRHSGEQYRCGLPPLPWRGVNGWRGIYLFDRAAKPIIFWSPVGSRAHGAFYFRRRVPKVRERLGNLFALQGRVICPHLAVRDCLIVGL